MAAFHLLTSPLLLPLNNQYTHSIISSNCFISIYKSKPIRASINGVHNGSPEPPKPTRRGRKKSPIAAATPTTKKPRRSQKSETENGTFESKDPTEIEEEFEDFDDGIDFPYDDPPLVCCFGAARKEFVPTVRVSDEQMHPDIYADWKMLQWDPPEFARAPGGPPSNVAISHVRLGGRAAFMGKIGSDEFGQEMLYMMNKEKVQTRAVKIDGNGKTGVSYMKIKFDDDGKIRAEKVKEAPEDSFLSSELNFSVLKEVC